jgi:hypothetical protein
MLGLDHRRGLINIILSLENHWYPPGTPKVPPKML